MSVLNPTPPETLVDGAGRPYFLWDMDLTLSAFQEKLRMGDEETRAYFVGKLMRQAKPDDVFSFATVDEICALWSKLRRYLGKTLPFWDWLLTACGRPEDARG
jgi:hypothetical protein